MSFTYDVLLRTLQILKNQHGGVEDKSFLMLGQQETHLNKDFLYILREAELIEDISKFGTKELNNSVAFLKAFGFKDVHALDVSEYENADIIFDLNEELPREYESKFDVVYDGGVIEHVFDIGNAFMNICKLTKVGGLIFNINPVYNYLHNLFYCISPEMFLDFYAANNYKILDASMITYLAEDVETRSWMDRPIIWSPDVRLLQRKNVLGTGEHVRSLNKLCTNPHPHTFFVARKTNNDIKKPIVSGYAQKHREYDEKLKNNK